MKKQKALYFSLSITCILQYLAVLFVLIIVPISLLPALVIAGLSGALTAGVLFLLIQKLEVQQYTGAYVPPSLPQYTQNQDINMLIYDLKKELQDYQEGACNSNTVTERLKNALKEKAAELQKLRNTLKEKEEETEQLKKTARQMQGWIESFPYEITPQFKLYNLLETEIITGSYSRWLVSGEENGMLFAFEFIRPDSQNKIELFQMLQKLQTKENIIKLDMAKEKFTPELQAS